MKKPQRIFALAMAILMSISLASCTSVKEKNSGTAGEGSAGSTSGESGTENASLSAGESGSPSGGVTLPDESDMFPEISAPDSIDGAVSIVFSEKSVVCGSSSVTVDGSMASITGGIFVAAGASGMMMNFGQTSTQGSILTSASGTSKITLSDEDGNVLISFTPSKSCACVVISCPELVIGGKYTISVGSNITQIELTSLIYGSSGGMNGGRPGGGFGGGGKRP